MTNIQATPKYLWSNVPQGQWVSSFLATLETLDSGWGLTEDFQVAALWVFENLDTDFMEKINHILEIWDKPQKPKIIFLAEKFKPLGVKGAVFFKVPLNEQILDQWLRQNVFESASHLAESQKDTGVLTGSDNSNSGQIQSVSLSNTESPASVEDDGAQNTFQAAAVPDQIMPEPQWRLRPFKLNWWPNVSGYESRTNLVAACSFLSANFAEYGQMAQFNVPPQEMDQFLSDAEAGGYLDYLPDGEVFTPAQPKPQSQLFERFRKKFDDS